MEGISSDQDEIDKNAYHQDKNCVICNSKFGNIGITITKKYFCKFCYRGVCEKCSENRVNNNRCCKKCFLPTVQEAPENVDSNTGIEVNEEDYTQKSKEVSAEIEVVTKEIEDADADASEKRNNYERISARISQKKSLEVNIAAQRQKLTQKKIDMDELNAFLESRNTLQDFNEATRVNNYLKQRLQSLNDSASTLAE